MKKQILLWSLLLYVSTGFALSWEDWKVEFYQKAVNEGVSTQLLAAFLEKVEQDDKVVSYDQTQAEYRKFIWEYLDSAVSEKRVTSGQDKYLEKRDFLNTMSRFSRDGQYLLAIWGMETSYGSNTGSTNLVNALATLAYDGRRQVFFENELITLLKLIDNGDVPFTVTGSWAGGMGHTQFIPSTYQGYAVDIDNDGKRNLWDENEALASAANYLLSMGWTSALPWGFEVSLPPQFDYLLANNGDAQSLAEWRSLGVTLADGSPLPTIDASAKLFVPAGASGPKFLTTSNFDVIKKYNNSDLYALSVSLLADAIAGKTTVLSATWPTDAKRLNSDDIKQLQMILNQQGFEAGDIDGIFGKGTRRALQRYQNAQQKTADGYLSESLFEEIISQ